ncbi:MAG: catalase [Rubrivivax sp.]|nr:catalase [Rubrivivax sp.]
MPALGPLTVSGPSAPLAADATADAGPHACAIASMKAAAQDMAAARPHNAGKAAEHGLANATRPPAGEHQEPGDPIGGASTLTEDTASAKLGSGEPPMGENTTIGSLDAVRVDAAGQAITTNHGVAVADNQSSLKAGLRGPTLLEDFILREKITHFDHERIPERVVHARGSAAHGVFECYEDLSDITRASLFARAGKLTPVFVRFSTVAGERGSADAVRDTRGFAVKFYTPEGNWDLVGNNIPVFFIQDAMKFPDLVHAVKPEPHHAMPQASSAHDTFWDFVSLMPESIHHVLWVMSDRGIPRSYRTMQGFGVHAFRFVNERGESRFVKFHWVPLAGTHSLVWDEAVKVNGADPDFHRRDLWEAIEAGNFPEYELAIQVITEAEAETFNFDILDPTKIVPEELVPLRTIGKLTLNRNPDNFFAETEQVAFCTANIVPGIDFSNDPLLQGRNHSYLDTQLSRLGGPNFQQIPINMPLAPVFNNQRDAMHQHQVHRGRVNYEPNSLAGGCPHQAGLRGFASFAATGMRARADGEGTSEDKVRGKPEKFADHYSQAQLFWRSQSAVEQRHLAAALRFELSRATVPAIRERMVSVLLNVDRALAEQVADGLGLVKMPEPQPLATERAVHSEVEASPGLSLFARPGDGRIAGRRIAIIAADGVEAASLRAVQQALTAQQAVASVVGCKLGALHAADGEAIEADTSVEALPSVLWDALVLPAGADALPELTADGRVVEFVRDQYRHCKTILVLGGDTVLLEAAGVSRELIDEGADPGLIVATPADENEGAEEAQTRALQAFVAAVAKHRHFERELDPPAV